MSRLSFKLRDTAISCAAVVVAYLLLFQVVARPRLIEKVMAMNFSVGELALVASFLICRLAVYLLVPSALAASLAHSAIGFRPRRPTSARSAGRNPAAAERP